jgi:hypothetical protein
VLGYNYPGSAWYGDSYALFKTHVPTAIAEGGSGSGKPTAPPPSKRASGSWFGHVFDSIF